MSSIFFQPRRDHDGVDCLIYDESGRLLAQHWMSVDGARIRCHDFEAAIEDAAWDRDLSETLTALGLSS